MRLGRHPATRPGVRVSAPTARAAEDVAAAMDSHDTTAHDSLLASAGTTLARVTGVARVIVIAAVLGPTTFGNAFQISNSVPNLIYYGFLAGSLVSSLIVPALVRHQHADPARAVMIARGFLGLVLAAGAATVPVMVLGLPLLLRLTSGGDASAAADEQIALVVVLAAFTAPQILLYGVAGTGAAVMYAHRRFALPSCAPAVENLGILLVFGICAATYGTGSDGEVPLGQLLLLGLGSTGAVALHAALQWFGARRCGVMLLPSRGWAVPEVRAIVARAFRSMFQAGLLAAQTLALLVVAAQVPGGVVALQIALNFYFLPIALIATPFGLAALPRLARLHQRGEGATYWDLYVRTVMLGLFLVIPAAAGYVVLAEPIARVVGIGEMATPEGYRVVAGALAMLSLGLVGAALFFISTQACYAREDSSRPLRSMKVQTVTCLTLIALAVAYAPDAALVHLVSAAYAAGSLVGALHLFWSLGEGAAKARRTCLRAAARVLTVTAVMVPGVLIASHTVSELVPGRLGSVLAVVAGSLTGAVVFGCVQALVRAPELRWLRSALRSPASVMVEVP